MFLLNYEYIRGVPTIFVKIEDGDVEMVDAEQKTFNCTYMNIPLMYKIYLIKHLFI